MLYCWMAMLRSLRAAVAALVVLAAAACADAGRSSASPPSVAGQATSVPVAASSTSDGGAPCEPSLTELDPLLGIEVHADGPDEVEGWALVFNTWDLAPGEPLTIPTGKEAKIVWRLTGDGDLSFRAIGPKGEVENLVWGPEQHGGSNWERPGEEWGTGWLLPATGCWTLEVTRGAAVLSISAEAT